MTDGLGARGEPLAASAPDRTLSEFILREQRRWPGATGSFTSLLDGIRLCCKRVDWLLGHEVSAKERGTPPAPGASTLDSLEAAASDAFLRTLEWRGSLAAMGARGMAHPHRVPAGAVTGSYLLAFEPLDGSGNLAVNEPPGSIFSIRRAGGPSTTLEWKDFLGAGTEQVAAGYCLYGPTTVLVLTTGHGVHGFTLDRGLGEFILTHPALSITTTSRAITVDPSRARFWDLPVQRYVEECVRGRSGPRNDDFTTRWTPSLVAEVHHVLVRGGLFVSPGDTRQGCHEGRLSLVYQAAAMAMLAEQAQGAASTGRGRILDIVPCDVGERTPLILGAKEEVIRLERYHHEHDSGLDPEFASPLFNERSLFPPR